METYLLIGLSAANLILLAVLLHFLPDAAFVRDSRVIPYLSMITGYVKTFLPQQLF